MGSTETMTMGIFKLTYDFHCELDASKVLCSKWINFIFINMQTSVTPVLV